MSASMAGVGKGETMPKYLFQASYTLEGVKGLLEEGGSSRAKALDELQRALRENRGVLLRVR